MLHLEQYNKKREHLMQEINRLIIALMEADLVGQTNSRILLSRQLEMVIKKYIKIRQAETSVLRKLIFGETIKKWNN